MNFCAIEFAHVLPVLTSIWCTLEYCNKESWAQHTGIAGVEVRVDGGPWRPAVLSTEVSVDTWRMWHLDLALDKGDHTAEARATDRSGYTQTEQRVPVIPNGATGWPSVSFTVG